MQNSNPSRNPVSSPSLLQALLERTFLGARPASTGAAPTGADISGAGAASGSGPSVGDVHDTTDTADASDSVGRLELAELLGVLRDPIEWVFTLAERRAQSDPVDIAAIHRVRDAVLHRVNAIIVGVSSAESPRIRAADLWTVSSLLIDTLDPDLVQRVLRGIGSRIADVLAAGLPFDSSIVAHLGQAAASIAGPDVPPFVPPWYLGGIPSRAVAPFGLGYGAAMPHLAAPCGSCLGPCPGSLAKAHALRSTVPPWCWSQFPVSF